LVLVSGIASPSIAAIVPGDSPAVPAVVTALAEVQAAAGETPAAQSALKTAPTGSPTPRDADEDAPRRMLMEARQYVDESAMRFSRTSAL
jgi:hypothetical protein